MKILVTGNKGYIGSVLTGLLRAKGYEVVGYDTCYYDDCAMYTVASLATQIRKDVRDAVAADF